MRNIYDIIAEQKAIIDINIASYEMNYLNEYFTNNNDDLYIQEGIGDTLKNLAAKVIQFIKAVINKIKEIAHKLINWITGKKDTVKKLNDEINEANMAAGGGGGEGSSNNDKQPKDSKKDNDEDDGLEEIREKIKKQKEENEKYKKEAERKQKEREEAKRKQKEQEEAERKERKDKAMKKLNNIEEVLKECKTKAKFVPFTTLDNKVNLAKKFFNNMERVSQDLISKNIINDDILIREVIDKTFTGPGGFDTNSGSAMEISKRIDLELVESSDTPIESYISVHADKIYDYISKGDQAIKYIQGQEKTAVNNLNKLLRYVEQISSGNQLAGDDAKLNKRINMIKAASSAISEFVMAICKSIVKSINVSTSLAEKAKNDYKAQIANM